MEFVIEIRETLQKRVTVEANALDDALDLVKRRWKQGEYVLDAECFTGVAFGKPETEIAESGRNYERYQKI